MISLFLLLVVAAWWLVEQVQQRREERQDRTRRQEILALRQRYVGARPHDPVAQALLGDALRQAGYPAAALDAYSDAERLYAGQTAGAELAARKRLTALEVAQSANPERFQQTLQTRESVCRSCGSLNLPQRTTCHHCDLPLLVEGFWETMAPGGRMRGELLRELWPLAAKTLLVLVAVAGASALPLEIRGAVLIATIIVVPIAALRQLGNPTQGD